MRQAIRCVRWLNRHPWATPTQVKAATDKDGIILPGRVTWTAVRTTAYDVAPTVYKNKVLVNGRLPGGGSVWAVTGDATAILVHAVNRLRHSMSRDMTLARWMARTPEGDSALAILRPLIMSRADTAMMQAPIVEALDLIIATERADWVRSADIARKRWDPEYAG